MKKAVLLPKLHVLSNQLLICGSAEKVLPHFSSGDNSEDGTEY